MPIPHPAAIPAAISPLQVIVPCECLLVVSKYIRVVAGRHHHQPFKIDVFKIDIESLSKV